MFYSYHNILSAINQDGRPFLWLLFLYYVRIWTSGGKHYEPVVK